MVDQAPDHAEAAVKATFDEYVLLEVDVMCRVAMSLIRNAVNAADLD